MVFAVALITVITSTQNLVTRLVKVFLCIHLLLVLEFYENLVSINLITNPNIDHYFTNIEDLL